MLSVPLVLHAVGPPVHPTGEEHATGLHETAPPAKSSLCAAPQCLEQRQPVVAYSIGGTDRARRLEDP